MNRDRKAEYMARFPHFTPEKKARHVPVAAWCLMRLLEQQKAATRETSGHTQSPQIKQAARLLGN